MAYTHDELVRREQGRLEFMNYVGRQPSKSELDMLVAPSGFWGTVGECYNHGPTNTVVNRPAVAPDTETWALIPPAEQEKIVTIDGSKKGGTAQQSKSQGAQIPSSRKVRNPRELASAAGSVGHLQGL